MLFFLRFCHFMAVEKVKKIIAGILERPEYLLDTPRNIVTRKAASELLESMQSESNGKVFSEFATGLETAIRKAFPAKMPKRSAREKVLSRFHSLTFANIEKVWERLYHQVGNKLTVDRMVRQYTNDKIFAEMYVSQFATTDSQACTSVTGNPSLTVDEENIVRYVAGYVPLKLMRKYEKQESFKAALFVETLSHMKVNGQEADFAAYATMWIEEVNRGGLFEVNESAYCLFRLLELLIHDGVPNLVLSREEMLQRVSESNEVQFQWTMLSVDIDDDDLAQELLEEISSMWLSIRSHALTRRWMETYKQSKKKSTKKSKALRKELRKKEEKKGAKEEKKKKDKEMEAEIVGEEKVEGEEEEIELDEEEIEEMTKAYEEEDCWPGIEDYWECPAPTSSSFDTDQVLQAREK